jgi:TRAP-type C4-dicarboxylate transport system substrate-binding protein
MKGLKIRVPDAPLYTMFPRAVGANPTPIAFAEVYLALQNGTVDAQENPLPTIDAKKFYEVQKYIVLTGHITDALLTIVAGGTWGKLSDADKKVFEDVLRQAADRATGEIVDIEKKMSAELEKRGKTVVRVDRKPFRDSTAKLHNGPDATWSKDVYDRLQKL